MITNPHDNQIASRFHLASHLQSAAHHFDMKPGKDDGQKALYKNLATLLTQEANAIYDLGLLEITTQREIQKNAAS